MDINIDAIARNDQTKQKMKECVFKDLSDMPEEVHEAIIISMHDHLEMVNAITPSGAMSYVYKYAMGLGLQEFQEWILEWNNQNE